MFTGKQASDGARISKLVYFMIDNLSRNGKQFLSNLADVLQWINGLQWLEKNVGGGGGGGGVELIGILYLKIKTNMTIIR